MVKITSVERRSKAARAKIMPGDVLVSINGNEICDVLDYRFYLAECEVTLLLLRGEGEISVKIRKGRHTEALSEAFYLISRLR